MDEMSLGDKSNAEPMSTDMLKDIHDRSQYLPKINSREVLYKIYDSIKQRQGELKGELLSTRNMGKGLYKVFKAVVNEISESLPIM